MEKHEERIEFGATLLGTCPTSWTEIIVFLFCCGIWHATESTKNASNRTRILLLLLVHKTE